MSAKTIDYNCTDCIVNDGKGTFLMVKLHTKEFGDLSSRMVPRFEIDKRLDNQIWEMLASELIELYEQKLLN